MSTNAEPFGISDKLPVTSDVLVRAREALGSIDPNKWPFITPGIGPTTRFIAASPQLVADLTDEVEKLRGGVCAICGGAGSRAWGAWFAAERDEWQRRAYEAAGEAIDHRQAHKQDLAALARVRELAEEMAAAVPGEDPITDGCLPADIEQINGQAILRALDGEAQG